MQDFEGGRLVEIDMLAQIDVGEAASSSRPDSPRCVN